MRISSFLLLLWSGLALASTFTAHSRSGWSASASTSLSGSYLPGNAIDGNAGTDWITDGSAFPQYLILDMASAFSFDEIRLTPRAAHPDNNPASIDLYVSDDGSTWGSAVERISGISGSQTTDIIWQLTNFYNHRYLKLNFLTSNSAYVGLTEVNVGTVDISSCKSFTAGGPGSTGCYLPVHAGDRIVAQRAPFPSSTGTFVSTPSLTWTQQYSQIRDGGTYLLVADARATADGSLYCGESGSESFTTFVCVDIGQWGNIDAINGASGTSSAGTVSLTTSASSEFLLVANQQQGSCTTFTTGYFLEQIDCFYGGGSAADKISGGAGSQSATSSVSSSAWVMVLVAYAPCSGPCLSPAMVPRHHGGVF